VGAKSLFVLTICKKRANSTTNPDHVHAQNTESSIDASKKVGVRVNAEKTKRVAVSSPECRAKSRHKVIKQIV
jgi:hypothetical protein